MEAGAKREPRRTAKARSGGQITRTIFEQDSEAITRALAAELKKGNAKVFSALADRAYGKPRQQVEFAGEDGGPVQTSVVVHFVSTGNEEKVQ